MGGGNVAKEQVTSRMSEMKLELKMLPRLRLKDVAAGGKLFSKILKLII